MAHERIRLIATSDVHGTIYAHDYAVGKETNQGFAKISTLVRYLKDENTLLLDNGDVLEGSALATYHYNKRSEDISPVTDVMREMKYNYVNVGNHDFNYGEHALMMHLQNVGAPCLTSNWFYHKKPYGPTYAVEEIAGLKIAIFGIVTHYIPHWERKANIRDSRFVDAFKAAKKAIDKIKRFENPDIIVCMYHGGFERDLQTGYLTEADTGENIGYKILKELGDIDILITGHQHRSLCGKLGNTVYTQTAANGEEVAVIDIYVDNKAIDARILKAETPEDKRILKYAEKEEAECQEWLDTTLGIMKNDLVIEDEFDARLHKSQVITFLNQVQREATGADLSSCALFTGATGFRHEIKVRDLVGTYVYPNTLVVKKITGKILREYLERCAEFWTVRAENIAVTTRFEVPKPQYYNYDMVDGVDYTIKVSNPIGKRIVSLTYNGEEVTDDMEFMLALNNYRAGGGGDFEMIKAAPTVGQTTSSMVELLIKYISKHEVIEFEPVNNITVIR